MIASLHIKNVAVIKELSIDFSNGFSTFTGETGAGKSVIMDCIGILIGTRPVKGKVRHGETEASVSACFDKMPQEMHSRLLELGFDPSDGILIQRNFNAEGKSTFRINCQPVTQGIAKEIGARLITIHGQNDNQRLMQKSEHLGILDAYADTKRDIENYRESYLRYCEVKQRLSSLQSSSRERARMLDIYKFQAEEIDEVNPKIGEEEKLTEEEKRLQNVEKIQKLSNFTYHVLRGADRSACALIDKATSSVSSLEGIISEASSIEERLLAIRYELEDIAQTASAWGDDDGENVDKKLDKIGARLNAIEKLKRKYGDDIEEILEFRQKIGREIDEMENSDELIASAKAELSTAYAELLIKANALTAKRRDAALKLQNAIMSELEFLEMPKVRFIIDIAHLEEPGLHGLDEIEFLISANAGQNPMPMIKIASGGELSRIMLAIKTILLDRDGADAVVFDEIDTGISGKTSRKVGIKLKQISRALQVICVTHSAQIASLADNHYLISKQEVDGKTQTSIKLLHNDEQVAEIARILGGLNVTENQTFAAKEMIEEGNNL